MKRVLNGVTMMNRSNYFNYIDEKLHILSSRISHRGKINLLELNIHSETFFAEVFSILFNVDLLNLNAIKQNSEAIDLIDEKNKIFIQVSSTCSKQKIDNSLAKSLLNNYPGYRFKFIAITGDGEKLRNKKFTPPNNIIFIPKEDIYDIASLLNIILFLKIKDQRNLYELIKEELGTAFDIVKVDSNLASIINVLSKEDLSSATNTLEINTFEITKKIEFNDLLTVRPKIEDYKVFYSRLDEKYSEFDKQGANKSLSVWLNIRNVYIKLSAKISDPNELFFSIIDEIIEKVQIMNNFIEIPYEELEMCVSIIVVDAFIRCRIFNNPEGYNHVITR